MDERAPVVGVDIELETVLEAVKCGVGAKLLIELLDALRPVVEADEEKVRSADDTSLTDDSALVNTIVSKTRVVVVPYSQEIIVRALALAVAQLADETDHEDFAEMRQAAKELAEMERQAAENGLTLDDLVMQFVVLNGPGWVG